MRQPFIRSVAFAAVVALPCFSHSGLAIAGPAFSAPAPVTADVAPAAAAAAAGASAMTVPEAAAAARARGIAVEPAPDWVVIRHVPEASAARIAAAGSGMAYLMNDFQVRARADGHDDWFRAATRVVDRSGLEGAGQISLTFDPEFESAAIIFVHVIRDGKVIDRTADTRFRIVAEENALDEGIVGGSLKAMANVPDVRVGDVVDFAMVTRDNTRLWPGQVFQWYGVRYSDPLAFQALRYIWPKELEPRYKLHNAAVAFARKEGNGTVEWEWTAIDPPAARGEDNVPNEAFQWGAVDISTMKSWGELSAWALKLYQGDESFPADFAARVDAIAAAAKTPADRLTGAVRLVQDSIRYVGEELGEGSYVPRRPRLVIERGYGDCKDKALLLALVLRRLGITADPALVSSSNGLSLPDRLPSPLAFDHVIVRAVVDGKVTWIDATDTHQGGRGLAIVPADFDWALPIRPGQSALERMAGAAALAGRINVVERFAVDEAAAVPLRLHVETTYTAARADSMRAHLADAGAAKIGQQNVDFYRKRFAGLAEVRPVAFADDRDSNVLTMVEDYTLSRDDFARDKIPAKLVTTAFLVSGLLPTRPASPRKLPLALPDHVVREQVIELSAAGRVLWQAPDFSVSAGDLTYSRTSTRSGDGVRMVYRFDSGSRARVPAAEAEAVYAVAERMGDEDGLEFYLDKSTRPPESAGLDQEILKPLQADILRVIDLQKKGDDASLVEALGLLGADVARLKSPSPEAGLLEGMRGGLLVQLKRYGPALTALRSATAQFTGNPEVFRTWLALELDRNEPALFNTALRRAAEVQKPVVATLDLNWIRVARQHIGQRPEGERRALRDDLCIALAESGWNLAPRTEGGDAMLGCAIGALARKGELARARTLLALDPGSASLTQMAMDRRYEALWPELDRQGADGFRKVLEREVSAAAAAQKAAPASYPLAQRLVTALRRLGRLQEAADLARPMVSDHATVENVGEDAAWLVDAYANVLQSQGKPGEALAAFDDLMKMGIDNYPWLVSLAINRATVLNAMGRHGEVLTALAELEVAGKPSPYGRRWMDAEKACALHGLGRGAEAAPLERAMALDPSVNPEALTRATACRGDVAAVAAQLVARLDDEYRRDGVLGQFLPSTDSPLGMPFEARVQAVMKQARARPEVQAALRRVGRTIRYAGTSASWSVY
jgi:transglutaminase-like putative cysteine protease/tetratricopeptide (TPR) repeat protein